MLSLAAPAAFASASTYVVGYGDTLSDIALRFYGSSDYWDEILAANPQVPSPEALMPGTELVLPDIAGASVSSSTPAYQVTYVEAPTLAATAPMLSRIRLEEAGFVATDPIPAVARIVGVNVEEPAGTGNDDAYLGDLVEFDLGEGAGVHEGDVFRIVTVGETAIDPETDMTLGPVVRVAGTCRVTGVTPETSVALLEQSCLPTRVGDLVLPYQPAANIPIQTQPAVEDISAWVVALQDSESTDAYTFDVVYLDRGSEAGLHAGDVFQAFKYGVTATGLEGDLVHTADIPVAEVVVLDTQRTTCSAIVSMNSTSDVITVGDRLRLARREVGTGTR